MSASGAQTYIQAQRNRKPFVVCLLEPGNCIEKVKEGLAIHSSIPLKVIGGVKLNLSSGLVSNSVKLNFRITKLEV